jgi:hypothetical protein
MRQIRLRRQEHLWFRRTFGPALLASGICGNCCGNQGLAEIGALATAFYQRFFNHEHVEKNLHLHKSRALTFHVLQLGSLMSTVERVSQNKQWLIRSRLSDQVQWSDPVNTRTRKIRQALRGAGWGQELRKQWSHQGL